VEAGVDGERLGVVGFDVKTPKPSVRPGDLSFASALRPEEDARCQILEPLPFRRRPRLAAASQPLSGDAGPTRIHTVT